MIPYILVKSSLSFREAFLLYLQGTYSQVAIACCLQLQEPSSCGGCLKLVGTTWIRKCGDKNLLQREV